MKMLRKLTLFAMLLCAATLQACQTPGPPPQTADNSLRLFRPIGYSTHDTCNTQKQIAAHNSVYDTLKSGKPVVYQAPCEHARNAAPPQGPAS